MSLPEDDEGLAAEYVLGTLDAAERAAVAARRLREPELEAAISVWETRLAPLSEATPPQAPPAELFSRIEARLGAASPVVDLTSVLSARLARWRAVATGAGALATALAAALAFVVITRPSVPHQFVAVLQKGPDEPAFAMTVDVDKQEFTVRPVAAKPPEGKSYELWIIAPTLGAPKSLGVIDANAVSPERRLSAYDPSVVRAATYAVTLEPQGGSPNGAPSGAPVFVGKLIPVGP
jgi:anti-sigma-K factor RskA